ncbi:MAG TPA: DUF1127 domain-containing protein [Burkholderiaceae bacterium]|nr:DUF1127 domain-containing protein [Burkholderiaceae bacterium]
MKDIVNSIRNWVQRSNERYLLAGLSDWQLRDIGLDRFQVQVETTKPFWRS